MVKKYIPTLESLDLIKTGFAQNVAAYKIAKQIGCNQNVLHKICKEYGIINPKSATIITEEIVELVKKLFLENVPLRKIAEKMDLDVKLIKKVCNDNNLLFSERGLKGGQKPLPIPKEKLCPKNGDSKGCGLIKSISEFKMVTATRDSGNTYTKPSSYCENCDNKILSERSKIHYENNPEYYKDKNERNKSLNNISRAKRIEANPSLKLRHSISSAIREALKKEDGSKNGSSVFDYLPYTFEELKAHFKSKFIGKKSWMNWENYGAYRLGGENKWQIDHIIPQSVLPYDSMEHPNFQKCWALDNLQPLDAVENIQKGNKILTYFDEENDEEYDFEENNIDFTTI